MPINKINEDTINIRSIQHYLYCAHRWGLLEIDKAWSENYFVTRANLLHERVHDPKRKYVSKDKKVYSAVEVYNDSEPYRIYGVVDSLEIAINNQSKITIVEYKPTKPKNCDFNYDDAMQIFAQKICIDNIFSCDCEGYLYFTDVKKRVKLPLKEEYNSFNTHLQKILKEMRAYRQKGQIPPIQKSQKCSGCSLKNICMPKLKKAKSLATELKELMEG